MYGRISLFEKQNAYVIVSAFQFIVFFASLIKQINEVVLEKLGYTIVIVSSFTNCNSLQKRYVPFQLSIPFYKISGFSL